MDTQRDLTSTWLATLSHRCRTQFQGHNLQIRRSKVVHGVDWAAGLGGQSWPIPACRVGLTGWSLDAIHPVTDPVSCERCRHGDDTPRAVHPVDDPDQLALDLEVDTRNPQDNAGPVGLVLPLFGPG